MPTPHTAGQANQANESSWPDSINLGEENAHGKKLDASSQVGRTFLEPSRQTRHQQTKCERILIPARLVASLILLALALAMLTGHL